MLSKRLSFATPLYGVDIARKSAEVNSFFEENQKESNFPVVSMKVSMRGPAFRPVYGSGASMTADDHEPRHTGCGQRDLEMKSVSGGLDSLLHERRVLFA